MYFQHTCDKREYKITSVLTRTSHEHCVSFANELYDSICYMKTMFTKGQSIRRHFLQYFTSKHSQLSESMLICSLVITLNMTPPELMRNPS